MGLRLAESHKFGGITRGNPSFSHRCFHVSWHTVAGPPNWDRIRLSALLIWAIQHLGAECSVPLDPRVPMVFVTLSEDLHEGHMKLFHLMHGT